MQIFHNPNFNFIKYRWHALIVSWAIIVAGLVAIWMFGLPLGVEFESGSIVIAQFEKMPGIDQVRTALDRGFPGGGQNAIVQSYGSASLRQVMIRVPQVGKEAGTGLSQTADAVVAALKKGGLGNFSVQGTEIVGPAVGRDLSRKGALAFLLSLFFILLYLWFRFELSFAVGATVATLHDILITAAFLVFFRYDLSLNVIAALLTMTGYSTNDTIVIFDRVRENLKGMRKDDIKTVVNVAVNQTLNRTIITGGTALLSVIALYLFGGEVLRGFAFTMIVGIITGTYSSVFIAAAIVTFWRRAPARVAPGVSAASPAARPSQTARTRARTPRTPRTS
jgi:preprotein translocase subunit SecF